MDENLNKKLFDEGLKFFNEEKIESAKKCFEQLEKEIPKNEIVLQNLSLIYYKLKYFEKSENKLTDILNLGKKEKKKYSNGNI